MTPGAKAAVAIKLRKIAMRLSLLETLKKFDDDKHTGPVIVHFLHGRPKSFDVPGLRIVLDNSRR